ncbi:MAG: glycosyltransferase [Chitinophagaceae bacterium]|nr:glycosyltransferase [Chitinophagaceae bacterium]MCW5905305.1 glycosyltransferase [Chitinophagaceae bacterium]
MIKIAYCIRADYKTAIGGDVIQLLKTKEFVEKKYPVQINIITNPNELNSAYNIAHIFNLVTRAETTAFIHKAKSLNIKIALSTIFWDYTYGASRDYAEILGYKVYNSFIGLTITWLTKISGYLFNKPRVIGKPMRKYMKDCVMSADVLLPNSIEELQKLAAFVHLDFNDLNQKTVVVYNATTIPENADTHDNELIAKYQLPKNYILQVGRIDYTKNQLAVLLALQNHKEIPIVILGRPNDKVYYKKVKQAASKRGNVFFVDEVPHHETYIFFKNAALHILPSLRESPGLVNLEALLNKCKIVVSGNDFLPFNTYFKDIAISVNPYSLPSIRKGIFRELNTNRDMEEISKSIETKFNWAITAEQTYSAYTKIMAL